MDERVRRGRERRVSGKVKLEGIVKAERILREPFRWERLSSSWSLHVHERR